MIYRQEKEKRRGIPKRGLSNAKHKRFEVTDERKKDIKTNRIITKYYCYKLHLDYNSGNT